jgi:hypothetical protein
MAAAGLGQAMGSPGAMPPPSTKSKGNATKEVIPTIVPTLLRTLVAIRISELYSPTRKMDRKRNRSSNYDEGQMRIRSDSLPAKNRFRFAADQFAFGICFDDEEWLTF